MKKNKNYLLFLPISLVVANTLGLTKVFAISTNSYLATSSVANNIIVTNYVVPIINFLSAGVGVIVISMVIIGGIQYTTSGGNPQGEANARKKIINALLAFLVFMFIYSFLDFLVPGGLITL